MKRYVNIKMRPRFLLVCSWKYQLFCTGEGKSRDQVNIRDWVTDIFWGSLITCIKAWLLDIVENQCAAKKNVSYCGSLVYCKNGQLQIKKERQKRKNGRWRVLLSEYEKCLNLYFKILYIYLILKRMALFSCTFISLIIMMQYLTKPNFSNKTPWTSYALTVK